MGDPIDSLLERLARPTGSSRRHCILTFTGQLVDPVRPVASTLDIVDVAHALSNTTRFGGHSRGLYTVAQHSVLVANLLPPDLALAGLLHDAAEAYLGDIPTPIKQRSIMRGFREAEDRLLKMLLDKFAPGSFPLHPDVVKADRRALHLEMQALMPGHGHILGAPAPQMECWPPAVARDAFLQTYGELTGVKPKSPVPTDT